MAIQGFSLINSSVNRYRFGPVYPIPIFACFLLLLFVCLPILSYWFDWSVFNNWYLVPDLSGLTLYVTFIVISFFISAYVDVLMVSCLLRSAVIRNRDKESGEDIGKDRAKITISKIKNYHFQIAIILVVIFIVQIIFLNKEDYIGEIWIFGLKALTISLFVFWSVTHLETIYGQLLKWGGWSVRYFLNWIDKSPKAAKIFHKIANDISALKSKEYISGSADKFTEYISKPLKDNYSESYKHTRETIDNLSRKLFIGQANQNDAEEHSAYVAYAISVWQRLLLLAVVTVYLMSKYAPTEPEHSKYPVIFYLTFLSIFILLIIQLIVDRRTTGAFLKDTGRFLFKVFSGFTAFVNRYKAVIFALLLTSVLVLKDAPQDKLNLISDLDSTPALSSTPKKANVYLPRKKKPLVVITAAGGGISASAWTAAVLDKLSKFRDGNQDAEIEWPSENFLSEISENISAFSGVSGGSLGVYYYLAKELLINKCERNQTNTPDSVNCRDSMGVWFSHQENIKSVFDLASRSSLGSIAWGIPAYELASYFLPWVHRGRERALEERWSSIDCEKEEEDSKKSKWPVSFEPCAEFRSILDATLAQWNAWGELPTFLFNTTVEQLGRRVVFTNKAVVPPNLNGSSGFKGELSSSDVELLSDCAEDLKVVELVRFSATFPYVTPPGRLGKKSKCYRYNDMNLIDGGYLDNSGIQSALDYLFEFDKQNKQELTQDGRPILHIKIEAYTPNKEKPPGSKRSAIVSELFSPIAGIMNTRAAQYHTNLNDIYQAKSRNFNIKTFTLRYPESSAELPLSWHLSVRESDAIRCELPYNSSRNRSAWGCKDSDFSINEIYSIEDCNYLEPSDPITKQFQCMDKYWKTAGSNPLDETSLGQIEKVLLKISRIQKKIDSIVVSLGRPSSSETDIGSILQKRVKGFVCGPKDEPKVIAISPVFVANKPKSLLEWPDVSSLSKFKNCGIEESKDCKNKKIVARVKAFSTKIRDKRANQTYVIGLASRTSTPHNNFKLGEVRANWLKSLLVKEFGYNKDKVRSISWGELIPLHNSEAKVFHDLKDVENISEQFAFAIQCN